MKTNGIIGWEQLVWTPIIIQCGLIVSQFITLNIQFLNSSQSKMTEWMHIQNILESEQFYRLPSSQYSIEILSESLIKVTLILSDQSIVEKIYEYPY